MNILYKLTKSHRVLEFQAKQHSYEKRRIHRAEKAQTLGKILPTHTNGIPYLSINEVNARTILCTTLRINELIFLE